MNSQRTLLVSFLLALLTTPIVAIDKTVNPSLNAQLKLATQQIDKLALLPSDSDWRFDYTASPNYTFTPGSVVNANAATWPALTGYGMTLAMLNLGPCAMLPPHYHPRATNVVVGVLGVVDTFMIEENGARLVKETLTPGVSTIFPQGSLHMMVNTGCTNAQLVSALNSEDSGTHNIFNGAFLNNLPIELLQAALGNSDLDIAALAKNIPPVGTGSIAGSAACLKRCAAGGAANQTVGGNYTY